MSEPLLLVILPAERAGLAPAVLAAGGTPVIDLTCGTVDSVPQGAWVRVLAGQQAPGDGPVILADRAAPVRGRPTWLERTEPGPVPGGYAGILLRGREAGGHCSTQDGLALLATHGHGALLEAGLGPDTAAAAMALGAAGVVLREQLHGLAELGLGPELARRVRAARDTDSRVVRGFRVTASPLSPVVRRLAAGEDPWKVSRGWFGADDPVERGWPAGQGLALAATLARRHGSLAAVLGAYRTAMAGWAQAVAGAQVRADLAGATRVRTATALRARNGHPHVAEASGGVGSGVLWQVAAWENAPIAGGPAAALLATGGTVVGDAAELEAVRTGLVGDLTDALVEEHAAGSEERVQVAIVGVGVHVPGSPDGQAFWNNVQRGVNCLSEVPPERWDPAKYYDSDPKAPDKSYTRIGGFVKDYKFESRKYRIPPKVAKLVDPVQQLALDTVGEALHDAGMDDPQCSVDRSRVAIILGNSMGGEITDDYTLRVRTPEILAALDKVPGYAALPADERARIAQGFSESIKAELPPITEDSMPGELSNVIAGRIANAFDLGGPNFTVDAACASSMAAIQAAVKGLQDGDFDVAVTGGVDRMMGVPTYIKFCKIGALSPDHSAPFDESANGFVMGEGAAILILKRLVDAERDGDRIYAVIRGIGASSDGKGKGITAPNIQGQKRALRRAYADAGIDPVELDLIECHGTSTVVGDKVEVDALSEVIGAGRRGARGPIRIGSVKSQIGHLKSAAGAVATIKMALALHHKVLPPSINFKNGRPDVPFDAVPLQVQTRAEDWRAEGWRRLGGVSAFGFGGTNFHMVLEEHLLQPTRISAPRVVEGNTSGDQPLPPGIWALSGNSADEILQQLDAVEERAPTRWNPTARVRLAAAAETVDDRRAQITRIRKILSKGGNPDLLRVRGIHYEDVPFDSKVAFLFTGQGSQYIGMGLDLAAQYPIVAQTFAEADAVMAPELGRPLTDYIAGKLHDDPAAAFEALRNTEIAQPATLTLDVAILRLLASFGVYPDLVAGHSLGEYGALVASGMMDFSDALKAVSARGREMAGIVLEDTGLMAGIATSAVVVESVLAEVGGYVVAANKNCPNQTVIAGATEAVEAACELFRSRNITVYPLPVSHAFHTAIVAPASEPLRRILQRLGIRKPQRPITTNVHSGWYPTEIDDILDLLSQQVAAPVEWTSQMERMYAHGARVFVEVGPKRALSGFTSSILKRRPHRAVFTNHPKIGGVKSFSDALAAMLVMGFPVRQQPVQGLPDLLGDMGERLASSARLAGAGETQVASPAVLGVIRQVIGSRVDMAPEDVDLDFELEADLGIDTVRQAELVAHMREHFQLEREAGFLLSDHKSVRQLADYFAGRLGELTPAVDRSRPAVAIQPRHGAVARQAPVPVAPAAPAVSADVLGELVTAVTRSATGGLDADSFAQALAPALQGFLSASWQAFQAAQPAATTPVAPPPAPVQTTPAAPVPPPAPTTRSTPVIHTDDVVCTGAAVGLPGGERVFDPDNFHAILRGENRITPVPQEIRQRMVDKSLVRLKKDEHGQGTFMPVTSTDEVIRLAGQAGEFDLAAEYGVDPAFVKALDNATQLAIAVGLEALRDAGIPLVRTFRTTTKGSQVPTGWALPESMRDTTGIIFASAWPGFSKIMEKLGNHGHDDQGHFDRRFLLQVLAMGHSQFAQHIRARGPNTQVNVACSSTTLAVGLASDWIRLGRCERVIVVGADDVTSPSALEWIGAGFVAAGAATTHDKVEEAALPFDKRRHGMIMGMGAVGLIIERAAASAERGLVPVAKLLSSEFANSAFHGTKLDVEHIQGVFTRLVQKACDAEGITPAEMASRAMFMSHETYTPARGGSADAEIKALRAAFGDAANQVVVSNTKGFTGHPMGAGIEDAIALKALQYEIVPPIPNLEQPDPALGDLRLSQGGHYDGLDYALRFSAGFGSQLALLVWRGIARGDDRVADAAAQAAWLQAVTGYDQVALAVERGTLRARKAEGVAPANQPAEPAPTPAPAPDPEPEPAAPAATATDPDALLQSLLAVIAEKTGYDVDELDPEYELEADLGIDTVKQAEIFSEVRDHFGVERDDDFVLSDYPTIASLAAWLETQVGGSAPATPAPDPAAPAPATEPAPTPVPTEPVELADEPPAPAPVEGFDRDTILDDLLGVISDKTGYERDELDLDYELEADLGIDTVKQAEIFSEVRDRFGVTRDDDFVLSDYPTIVSLVDWLCSQVGAGAEPAASDAPAREARSTLLPEPAPEPTPAPEPALPTTTDAEAPEPPTFAEPEPEPVSEEAEPEPVAPAGGYEQVLETVIGIVGEKTGYEREDLDPDYELEADLGIDTVKQAEIFSEVRELYGVERDDDFVLSDYPTLSALATWLSQRVSAGDPTLPADVTDVPEPATADMPVAELIDPPDAAEFEAATAPASVRVEPMHTPRMPPGLPDGFAVRQVAWRDQSLADVPGLPKRVYRVLGSGERAEALRLALLERGALLTGEPDVVVDTGGSVFGSFNHAHRLLDHPPSEWICVTSVSHHNPVSGTADGARAGLGKGLGRDWEGCTARTVQVDAMLPATRVAQLVTAELAASNGDLAPEVRLDANGVRQALELQVVDTPTNGALAPGQVILVTGGGRGICARIAQEFAHRSPCRLVLVGRTPAADEPLDEAAEKARIKQELTDAGEKATPKQVRDALAPMVKADEIRQTLVDIRATGAEVEYRTCDLADPDAVRGLVSEVARTHGRIDVCVHGAGVEVSKPLAEKTEAGFHRVFDGKALGGLALASALPAECQLLSMGSVAGRFGNMGQVDYSAANEAMAQVCHLRPHSLHIDWTAWDDVGMAVRGGMKTLLTGRGVQLLPADAGAAVTVDLAACGLSGEVVVSGALGGMLPSSGHPLVDSVDFDGQDWVLRHTLSADTDAWIVDHSIDGTPVLPGVIGVEFMAALATSIRPGASYAGVQDVTFDAPVKLHRGEPLALEVRGRPDPSGGIRCTLSSERTLKTGRVQKTQHFSGTVLTGTGPTFDVMPPAFFRSQPLDSEAIYQRFFHGPVFQVLDGADDVTRDGLLARGQVDHTAIGAVLTHPLVLEAAFQAAGLHAMVADGSLCLPRSIESLTLPTPPTEGEPLLLTVRRRGDAYDVDVEQAGRVVMALRGFRMIERGPLPEPERFPEPDGGYADRAFGSAMVVKAPSGVLNQAELDGLRLRGTPKRQAERIAGRVAAKQALHALTGAPMSDIRIANLGSGEPVATIAGEPGPAVSITHSGELAVAVARTGGRVGVDLEQIAERHPAFAQDWFTPGERALIGEGPSALTAGWTVKEAVLKALGTGMAISPRDVELTQLTDTGAEVALRGAAARKHRELGGGPLEIRLQRFRDAYLAEATLAA